MNTQEAAMVADREEKRMEPRIDIRIIRTNTDKTRKDAGSDTIYHIYFELSGHPPAEWVRLFDREWAAQQHQHEAEIDGGFLVLHSPLRDVSESTAKDLETIVAVINDRYDVYARENGLAREHREDLWKHERDEVETMSKSIKFK
jgi:hypothetical protein